MKDKLFISLIILVLALATAVLFWYGERVIYVKASTGYSVISFNSTKNTINSNKNDYEALTFFIHSFEKGAQDYKMEMMIDGKQVDSEKKSIGRDIKYFKPSKSTKKRIKNTGKDSVVYSVKINWEDSEEKISKKIYINE